MKFEIQIEFGNRGREIENKKKGKRIKASLGPDLSLSAQSGIASAWPIPVLGADVRARPVSLPNALSVSPDKRPPLASLDLNRAVDLPRGVRMAGAEDPAPTALGCCNSCVRTPILAGDRGGLFHLRPKSGDPFSPGYLYQWRRSDYPYAGAPVNHRSTLGKPHCRCRPTPLRSSWRRRIGGRCPHVWNRPPGIEGGSRTSPRRGLGIS